ncbi:winged helix-turn-helix domain-containing protein [Xanthobacter sp. DSM 24535]|uniref:winged helix-turn-helix domain-containing protein n=1 Tax=Roseixanthobacter psychrophilus TaxID=3119917 RepID=UPI003727F34B
MAIPDYQSLMLPLLKIADTGETRIPAVEERIATDFGLTEAEREAQLPSGGKRVLHNRLCRPSAMRPAMRWGARRCGGSWAAS